MILVWIGLTGHIVDDPFIVLTVTCPEGNGTRCKEFRMIAVPAARVEQLRIEDSSP
jgi:hypothetical protein